MAEEKDKYLNLEGLTRLWKKIDSTYATSDDLDSTINNLSANYKKYSETVLVKSGSDVTSDTPSPTFNGQILILYGTPTNNGTGALNLFKLPIKIFVGIKQQVENAEYKGWVLIKEDDSLTYLKKAQVG